MTSPDPSEIRAARAAAGHSQAAAAAVVYVARITWQCWELGTRAMPPGLFELYLIKTGQKILP